MSSFNNFFNVIRFIQKFGNQCKIKPRKKKNEIERRKMKERKRTRRRREIEGRFEIYN